MNPTFNLQDEINKVTAGNTALSSSYTPIPTGAYQYADGGQASMLPPVSSTPQPQSTPAAASTSPVTQPRNVATELERIKNEALVIQSQLNQMKEPTIGQTLATPTLEKDTPFQSSTLSQKEEEAIRRQQLKLYQREIDATNQVYDQMLNEARVQGQGRLGSTTALGARSGVLGSDFAQAQTDTINTYNRQINAGIGAERAAKIANIMGTARQAAVDEIAAKNAARKQDADALIEWHKTKDERRTKNLNTLAASMLQQGIDPTELDTKTINDIAKSYGITKEDIAFAYNTAKSDKEAADSKADLETRKTESEIEKNSRFNLSEGQGMYDAEGNLLASRAKTYAPGTGAGGSTAINLTSDDKRTLLGGGWSEGDISSIESDVRANGLDAVIAQAKAEGATSGQIAALQKAYGATGDSEQFLNKDYFKSLFGDTKLAESAKEAGMVTGGSDYLPFNESGDTEAYLTQLENTVNLYRQAGYTDQEILKMMQ